MEDLPLYDDDLVVIQLNKRDYTYLKTLVNTRIKASNLAYKKLCQRQGKSADMKRDYRQFKPEIIQIIHNHDYFAKHNSLPFSTNNQTMIT